MLLLHLLLAFQWNVTEILSFIQFDESLQIILPLGK